MRLRCLSALVILALIVDANLAIAEDAAPEKGNGVFHVEPVGLDGKVLKKNSVLLWRKVDGPRESNHDWHEAATDTYWEVVTGFSTGGTSTLEELATGTYRVSVREGHEQRGAFGISKPVTMDEATPRQRVRIELQPGGTLVVDCADADTGERVPPPRLTLAAKDSPWRRFQFRSDAVSGWSGRFEYCHLPAGKYELTAERKAVNPIDVDYELVGGPVEVAIEHEQVQSHELKFKKRSLALDEIDRRWPFVVRGKVTDKDGKPVGEAVVRAHTGYGTMFQSGAAISDAAGNYQLRFGRAGLQFDSAEGLGQLIVSASKPGMYEQNLNSQGELAMADRPPAELPEYYAERPLVLAQQPFELNFTLRPAAILEVNFKATEGNELENVHVRLQGVKMPPGSSVIDSGKLDKWRSVTFHDVPLDHEWHIRIGDTASQPFRLVDPQRHTLTLELRIEPSGVEVVDIVSITDTLHRDRTIELVSEDLLNRPADF